MKNTILFTAALFGLFITANCQNINKSIEMNSNVIGDTIITTKVTRITIDGKTSVEKEVKKEITTYGNSSTYLSNSYEKSDESIYIPKRHRGITAVNFTGSFINNNKTLNSKLGMRDINAFNIGCDFYFGYINKIGMEFVFGIGIEGWQNQSNNKQLSSLSALYSLNFGYHLIKANKGRFLVVPKVGIACGANALTYTQLQNADLALDDIDGHSWLININNFYMPLGLELRFGVDSDYFLLAGEYRYTFHTTNAYLGNSKQKVSDFPNFKINNVVIKMGYVALF